MRHKQRDWIGRGLYSGCARVFAVPGSEDAKAAIMVFLHVRLDRLGLVLESPRSRWVRRAPSSRSGPSPYRRGARDQDSKYCFAWIELLRTNSASAHYCIQSDEVGSRGAARLFQSAASPSLSMGNPNGGKCHQQRCRLTDKVYSNM